jgi:putative peptidoglycan lipid II flippase
LFLSLPASIALLLGSEEIVSALFGYGSFDIVSIANSSKALFYFAFGLPAFALIKIFSSFFFANDDTKTPFYISLVSVILNVGISVYYFKEIGFIIIPIATSISAWFNTTILFLYLLNKDLFKFKQIFLLQFIKISFASIIMGIFFHHLLTSFHNYLEYGYSLKAIFILIFVFLSLLFYLLVSFLIKAFKLSDIRTKY